VPSAVATVVWEEASLYLKHKLPRSWITDLTTRANDIYQHDRRFRQLMRQPGNRGRDWLWSFTRHWLAGMLSKQRPQLFARLPTDFAVGRALHIRGGSPAGAPPIHGIFTVQET
jgi:hypothetical protein